MAQKNQFPLNLRSGQSLTLRDGGEIGNHLYAQGASIDIQGGRLGWYTRVVETAVTISGGETGVNFEAFHGSTVDVTGGSVGGQASARKGSVWQFYGGNHGLFFSASDGSEVNVFGGSFGSGFTLSPGSTVNIHGGTFSGILAYGGTMNLFVKSALVNGVPLDLKFGVPVEISERGFSSLLEAVLADGSPLLIDLAPDQGKPPSPFVHPNAKLFVTLVPEPQAFYVEAVCIAIACLCRRKGRNLIVS
jgi:hypothetical protein